MNKYSGNAEATQATSSAYSTITADTSGASCALYDRSAAVDYAHTYAMSSNPSYDLSRGIAAAVNAVRGATTQPGGLVGWSRDGGATVHHFGVVTSVDNGVVSYFRPYRISTRSANNWAVRRR